MRNEEFERLGEGRGPPSRWSNVTAGRRVVQLEDDGTVSRLAVQDAGSMSQGKLQYSTD